MAYYAYKLPILLSILGRLSANDYVNSNGCTVAGALLWQKITGNPIARVSPQCAVCREFSNTLSATSHPLPRTILPYRLPRVKLPLSIGVGHRRRYTAEYGIIRRIFLPVLSFQQLNTSDIDIFIYKECMLIRLLLL